MAKKEVIFVKAPRNVHVVISRGAKEEAASSHEILGKWQVATLRALVGMWLHQAIEKHFGEEVSFQWVEGFDSESWRKLTTCTGEAHIIVHFPNGDSRKVLAKRTGGIGPAIMDYGLDFRPL